MVDRIYPRPSVDLDALLDALCEAGVDKGTVGTGNPAMIGISMHGATSDEIDTIWDRANDVLFSNAFRRARSAVPADVDLSVNEVSDADRD